MQGLADISFYLQNFTIQIPIRELPFKEELSLWVQER